ncbi:MAG: threonylcarbamoyl-AMP synthase [Clostridia bacterium]|nr:threonylcarbamoyl-AMP synthase [Clostridia bacterium]
MNTKILKINDNSLKLAKALIENGELVAIPTETVYGLGGLATSTEAVNKIFQAKGRPNDNPLIVHVHKNYDLSKLVFVDHDYVYNLIDAFMPGPLTLVMRHKGYVSQAVTCGLDTLAVRIPDHQGCQDFLKYVDLPIAAPSANVSKHTSPVTAEHVYNDLNGKIEVILDGGKCSGGIESTVLDVTKPVPVILRSGLVTAEMIKRVVGACEYVQNAGDDVVRSPGMKYVHYTPKCKTALFERNELPLAQELYDKLTQKGQVPVFLCDDKVSHKLCGEKLLLGVSGEEIASNLYEKLLEGEKIADCLIAIKIDTGSEIDIGVMNRLSKACKPYEKGEEI